MTSSEQQDVTQTLDVKGLQCPLPVLRAQKQLRGLKSGDVLEVHVTDPASTIDMPHFCNEAGHRLITSERTGDTFVFRIRKG